MEEFVRRWNIDGWGNADLEAIDEVFAPVHTLQFNELEPTTTHRTNEQLKQAILRFHAAMPDFRGTVDHLVADGDQVAFQVTWEGTHTEPFDDIPPSNKRWRWTDMLIARIEDGKVVEVSFGSKCRAKDVLRRLAQQG
jgi:predicted ester cyclase